MDGEYAAMWAGERGCGATNGFCSGLGHDAVGGVAGGGDSDEDVAGFCECEGFLCECEIAKGRVIFDGCLERSACAERNGGESGFQVFGKFIAPGKAFEVGYYFLGEGAFSFETFAQFSGDVN